MYDLIRPLLFKLEPEVAHAASLKAMQLVGTSSMAQAMVRTMLGVPRGQPVDFCGLRFPNRVGVAAGYDKDGQGWRGLTSLGFGHVEIGTVTPRPQAGNPKPRVFRLVEDRSVINRMGFPSGGADLMERHLGPDRPGGVVLGINIGKNKDTPLEEAAGDYETLVYRFATHADYLAVNVSSPNTPNLRRLQHRDALSGLLKTVVKARDAEVQRLGRQIPVLVKIAPDLTDEQLDGALDAITGNGVNGVIATNTTIARDGLRSRFASEKGGLSGAALTTRSAAMIDDIWKRTEGKLPIIGVGGIMSADDAKARLDAGATLVQVYTGLIYQGPGLAGEIIRATS